VFLEGTNTKRSKVLCLVEWKSSRRSAQLGVDRCLLARRGAGGRNRLYELLVNFRRQEVIPQSTFSAPGVDLRLTLGLKIYLTREKN
jgi:hypothetical protein